MQNSISTLCGRPHAISGLCPSLSRGKSNVILIIYNETKKTLGVKTRGTAMTLDAAVSIHLVHGFVRIDSDPQMVSLIHLII